MAIVYKPELQVVYNYKMQTCREIFGFDDSQTDNNRTAANQSQV